MTDYGTDIAESNQSTSILHEQNAKEVSKDENEPTFAHKALHVYFPNIFGGFLVLILILTIVAAAVITPFLEANPQNLKDSMKFKNIKVHLEKFAKIAEEDPSGSRSVINGYNASAEYVIKTVTESMEAEEKKDRVEIKKQYFLAPIYQQKEKPKMSFIQAGSEEHSYVLGVDFVQITYGGNGVYNLNTKDVVKVKAQNSTGCQQAHFQGHAGKVVFIEYDISVCELATQATNAQRENVAALVVFNPPTREALVPRRVKINDWEGTTEIVNIPVLSVSNTVGNSIVRMSLDQTKEFTLKISTNSVVTVVNTYNIIVDFLPKKEEGEVETPKAELAKIISVGAHLDGVPEGPGLNDNGSGSATVLELIKQILHLPLESKYILRFMFWGAEEIGLIGSRYYVRELSTEEKARHLLYINYDMLGSPNYVRSIHDGKTALNVGVRDRSGKLTDLFMDKFNETKRISTLVQMQRGSDFVPFADAGIPAGGVKTGAGTVKTEIERDWFGGVANAINDPCYHQSCDTLKNVNADILEQIAKNGGSVIEKLALHENVVEFLGEEKSKKEEL